MMAVITAAAILWESPRFALLAFSFSPTFAVKRCENLLLHEAQCHAARVMLNPRNTARRIAQSQPGLLRQRRAPTPKNKDPGEKNKHTVNRKLGDVWTVNTKSVNAYLPMGR